MKINNENEKYILYFIFHTLHFTYQIPWIHVMENIVNITYQVMGRQQITQNIMRIYKEKYIQVNTDYFIG